MKNILFKIVFKKIELITEFYFKNRIRVQNKSNYFTTFKELL